MSAAPAIEHLLPILADLGQADVPRCQSLVSFLHSINYVPPTLAEAGAVLDSWITATPKRPRQITGPFLVALVDLLGPGVLTFPLSSGALMSHLLSWARHRKGDDVIDPALAAALEHVDESWVESHLADEGAALVRQLSADRCPASFAQFLKRGANPNAPMPDSSGGFAAFVPSCSPVVKIFLATGGDFTAPSSPSGLPLWAWMLRRLPLGSKVANSSEGVLAECARQGVFSPSEFATEVYLGELRSKDKKYEVVRSLESFPGWLTATNAEGIPLPLLAAQHYPPALDELFEKGVSPGCRDRKGRGIWTYVAQSRRAPSQKVLSSLHAQVPVEVDLAGLGVVAQLSSEGRALTQGARGVLASMSTEHDHRLLAGLDTATAKGWLGTPATADTGSNGSLPQGLISIFGERLVPYTTPEVRGYLLLAAASSCKLHGEEENKAFDRSFHLLLKHPFVLPALPPPAGGEPPPEALAELRETRLNALTAASQYHAIAGGLPPPAADNRPRI